MTRRLEHEVKTLTKAVDEKLGSGVAGKLFEQKADEAALRKLYTQARRDTELIETLRTRMVATEEALASSRRETSESIEQVCGSLSPVSQSVSQSVRSVIGAGHRAGVRL